jgi:hypothetical protein
VVDKVTKMHFRWKTDGFGDEDHYRWGFVAIVLPVNLEKAPNWEELWAATLAMQETCTKLVRVHQIMADGVNVPPALLSEAHSAFKSDASLSACLQDCANQAGLDFEGLMQVERKIVESEDSGPVESQLSTAAIAEMSAEEMRKMAGCASEEGYQGDAGAPSRLSHLSDLDPEEIEEKAGLSPGGSGSTVN